MAKGNMILGYLRGAIGDIVFWRAKGQQMARARNRAPSNPRTESQMDVRARWAMISKFVRAMDARFLRTAFEGKRGNESDYNAFMRVNLSRAPMLSRTASLNAAYPAPGGQWVMTNGSLPPLEAYTEWGDEQLASPFWRLCVSASEITIPEASGRTIAWLTNTLLAAQPSQWRLGDIITFVTYSYDLSQETGGEPTAYPVGTDYKQAFTYRQIVLSATDTRQIVAVLGSEVRINTLGDNFVLGFSYGSSSTTAAAEWGNISRACTMIHSRNTSTGLQVSNSQLLANPNYALNEAYQNNSAAYKSAVLTDWRATEAAILQGVSSEVQPVQSYSYYIGNVLINGTTVSQQNQHDSVAGSTVNIYIQFADGSDISALTTEDIRQLVLDNVVTSSGLTVNSNAVWQAVEGQTHIFVAQFLTLGSTLPNSITVHSTWPEFDGEIIFE